MARDKILLEKDRVQKKLWQAGGKSISGYIELVHQKAKELQQVGAKLKYAK